MAKTVKSPSPAPKVSSVDLNNFDFKLPLDSLRQKKYDVRVVCKIKQPGGNRKYAQYYYKVYIGAELTAKEYKTVSIGVGKIDKKDAIVFVFDNKHLADDSMAIKYSGSGHEKTSTVSNANSAVKKVGEALNIDDNEMSKGMEILFRVELIDARNHIYKLIETRRGEF